MPEDDRLARFLREISAAQTKDELTAVATEIEQAGFDEEALERLTDAMREARETRFGAVTARQR